MVVAFHRFSGSRLSVMVSLGRPRDGFARAGRAVAPPGLVHILPTSLRPLLVQPVSSDCGNYPGADRWSHGVAERRTVTSRRFVLLRAHGPASLARFPDFVFGTG